MSPTNSPVIVWFRRDLRLADNPALNAAVRGGRPVIALYIHDPGSAGPWAEGGAQRWWLHHALTALGGALAGLGIPLRLAQGPIREVLSRLIAITGAAEVTWNRIYEPWAEARDTALEAMLTEAGLRVRSFNASLLFEPRDITTGTGTPFKVFTPFWRACRAAPPPARPLPVPDSLIPAPDFPGGETLADWRLLPTTPDWAGGLNQTWNPGEAGARDRLRRFLDDGLADYAESRDQAGRDGTSGLSPHLHFGEIGPRQLYHAILDARGGGGGTDRFLAELGWREFSAHLLHHRPDLPERPLRPEFADFPWREDRPGLRAWQRGRTGFPLVDAGLRQLWRTGWMHNRVRMIAASFLVKDLMIPWQEGARWFWDTLVDADLASNSASWQWVAGCGTDAAPYFRVFNPVLQGEKFDGDGTYVRRWCPELARLPNRWLHKPWQAPPDILRRAGVRLGLDYPAPILDHDQRRKTALAAYSALRP